MIPIAKPSIGLNEKNLVEMVLDSGQLAQGSVVEQFEKEFAMYCGVNAAVATNNGTSALHTAVSTFADKKEEILVPSFSFFASASAVSMGRCKPVFVDIDPTTFLIDTDDLQAKITDKTKAVISVDLFGQTFDSYILNDICNDNGLLLIEDACQAHGATDHNENLKAGNLGDIGCFSFYATKNMTTGEGGMITLHDDAFAEDVIRRFINHGRDGQYSHRSIGYNYRMTDIAAAIGLAQLKKLDSFNARRIANAEYYYTHIRTKGIVLPYRRLYCKHVYHQFVLKITNDCKLSRDHFIEYMKMHGIQCAIHYPTPIHKQPPYTKPHYAHYDPCPVSTKMSDCVVSIPVHPSITDIERQHIVDTINAI